MKDFPLFISQLQETNQTLGFLCDFDKIEKNVSDIRLCLCMLNSLIGAEDMRQRVETIWQHDRTAFAVMDILVAVRSADHRKVVDAMGNYRPISSYFNSVDDIMQFLTQTGLYDLLKNKKINDLNDYVFGIETGLDTNARKNRSGHLMEHRVASIFDKAGVQYTTEAYSSGWPTIAAALGTDEKRFDFTITTPVTTYLIDVNFYSGGGSKLNEVARSYTELAPKINSLSGFRFVWITDGRGWLQAKNKLEEAYNNIPDIYNLTTISEFIETVQQQNAND